MNPLEHHISENRNSPLRMPPHVSEHFPDLGVDGAHINSAK
jgi:hypothetical protein